jgi:hypothetical protein
VKAIGQEDWPIGNSPDREYAKVFDVDNQLPSYCVSLDGERDKDCRERCHDEDKRQDFSHRGADAKSLLDEVLCRGRESLAG